jgi:hypothetical protein
MKWRCITGGLAGLLLGGGVAEALVYDSIEKAALRYGDPVFSTVIEGRQTLSYKLELLYISQTYGEERECEKVVYSRMDKKQLEQDDFELIFRGEDARHGTVLSLSTPTVRFLQFDNDKVARVTLTDVTFFSQAEFRRGYGRVPSQKQLESSMQARLQPVYERKTEAKRRREVPETEALMVAEKRDLIQSAAPISAPVDAIAEIQGPRVLVEESVPRSTMTSTLVVGLLVGASIIVIAYLLFSRKPKEVTQGAEDGSTAGGHLEQSPVERGDADGPAAQESPPLILKRK